MLTLLVVVYILSDVDAALRHKKRTKGPVVKMQHSYTKRHIR